MEEQLRIKNLELARRAENIILDIKENLCQRLNFPKHVGLMAGSTGEVLFLLGYYELTKDVKILEKAILKMEQIIESLDFNYIGYSFAYGLSGIGWVIDLMNINGYIQNCSDEVFQQVDQLIFNMSIEDLKKGNYDYLSGGLGAALYFVSKQTQPITFFRTYTVYIINIICH